MITKANTQILGVRKGGKQSVNPSAYLSDELTSFL